MSLMPSALADRVRTPTGKRLIKYTVVSVFNVVFGQFLLAIAFGLLQWDATAANLFAVSVTALPSYYMNRAWAWGKRGKSHVMKEVVPFWAMAFLGLALSTLFVSVAEGYADEHSRLVQTVIINASALFAFGLLWIAKFMILNKLMFAHHEDDLPPALDGRTGIPT